jgi:hypothetical protein
MRYPIGLDARRSAYRASGLVLWIQIGHSIFGVRDVLRISWLTRAHL